MKHSALSVLVGSLLTIVACSSTPTPSPSGSPSSSQDDAAWLEQNAAANSTLVGMAAPAFQSLDDEGAKRNLDDYRGSWLVLYFFPRADTPGCTCQATEFTQLLQSFDMQGARVVGVSPDEPQTLAMFRRTYDLKIELLSDPLHETLRAYDASKLFEVEGESQRRVVRSTVLIDPQGRIAHHWPVVIPQGHAQRVQQQLTTLQAAKD